MFSPNNQEEKENCNITSLTGLQILKQVFYYVKKSWIKKIKLKREIKDKKKTRRALPAWFSD